MTPDLAKALDLNCIRKLWLKDSDPVFISLFKIDLLQEIVLSQEGESI